MVGGCLEHVFWGVLYDTCRHFSNQISPEAAQARYMDPESVRLLGTRLVHMALKLACIEPLMNVAVPRQWLGRAAASEVAYQSVGPIRNYQGGWQPPVGYWSYVSKKQS